MTSERTDLILHYAARRQAVEWRALWLVGFFVLLAALSRSPGFGLADPTGTLKGEINHAHIVIFGPVAVAALCTWFHVRLRGAMELQKRLTSCVHRGELGERNFNAYEASLAKSPACWSQRHPTVYLRTVYFSAVALIVYLLFCFLQFRSACKGGSIMPLLWGGWNGFKPEWPGFCCTEVPLVYTPYYQIGFLIIAGFIGRAGHSLRPGPEPQERSDTEQSE